MTAYVTGTATDMWDLYETLVDTLENNADLTTATETWTVEQRAYFGKPIGTVGTGKDGPFNEFDSDAVLADHWHVGATNLPAYFGLHFPTARQVKTFDIRAAGAAVAKLPDSMDLQWSDNGTAWTTQQSFSAGAFTTSETKTFTVTTPTSHAYWRIQVNSNNGDATCEVWGAALFDEVGNEISQQQTVITGPGLAGGDEIRVGLYPYTDAEGGRYNLGIVGLPTFVPADELNVVDVPFASDPVFTYLQGTSMTYWIVASGRRFVMVADCAGKGQSMYGGFFTPYSTPSEYPYPLMVGACGGNATWDVAETSVEHSDFTLPATSLQVYSYANSWLPFATFEYGANNNLQMMRHHEAVVVPPFAVKNQENGGQLEYVMREMRECFGGDYALFPLSMHVNDTLEAALGEMDGCFKVAGVNNTFGTILAQGGTNYLVVQNTYHTSNEHGYWALALE